MRTARSFGIPPGRNLSPGGDRGYYIDFTVKATDPGWPPPGVSAVEDDLHVTTAQWALGCIERHLDGDGDAWLEGALAAAEHLVATQGSDGGWPHRRPFPHTFEIEPPWLSAMAQGEGASLLVRAATLTGRPELLENAVRATEPLLRPPAEGTVVASLPDGAALPQEYPTSPPSHVLNGAIFALWGLRDVAIATGDRDRAAAFEAGVDALAANIGRWDTGYWSAYDLYPHPLRNVASGAYHELHVDQLDVLAAVAPRLQLAAAAERFRRYRVDPLRRARATVAKIGFRLAVPRNRLLARRLPWRR